MIRINAEITKLGFLKTKQKNGTGDATVCTAVHISNTELKCTEVCVRSDKKKKKKTLN